MKFIPLIGVSFTLILSAFSSGCGYTMRGQERPFFEQKNIRTLYIPPVKNDSYKSGIEILVYNTLRRRFAQWGYVRVIDSSEKADAKLAATVVTAVLQPQAFTRANQLANGTNAPANVEIASGYNVSLNIRFDMKNDKDQVIWTTSLSRSKSFQAATYFGALGSTSALINESQFDDTLAELASSVIMDAEESMNAVF